MERKAAEMVEFVGSRVGVDVDIGEVAFATVFDSLANLIFSRDCIGFEETKAAKEVKSLVRKLMELAGAPNVVDFFPILEKLDPQGLKRATSRGVRELYSVWKPFVNERREILRRGERTNTDEAEDFLDVFLENGLDDDQIDWLGLVRNRLINTSHPISKVQKSKLGKPLNESDIYNLPYLTAIVKETLRLHPPAPLLVPHRSLETLQVMNYTIPEGARLAVNAWAIGWDVSIWGEDAASFRPERFVGSSVDFRGHDFQLLPFSAGRRMCPGTSLAARQIPLLLANLVWNFDWSLPDGEESVTELDMEEKFGLTLQKEWPLVLVPQRRSLILQV